MLEVQKPIGSDSTPIYPYNAELAGVLTLENREPLELIRSKEARDRTEKIPLESILVDTPVIDLEHAAQLGLSMTKGRGQLEPILVRAREEGGKVVYDIADGFHRTSGKKAVGHSEIVAKVLYDCSDEELYDIRITCANSVRTIKFARVAFWMKKRFELTPWVTKLSLKEAAEMTLFNEEPTEEKGVTRDESTELKDWMRSKAVDWQMTVSELWTNLSIIEKADPLLVQMVRPDNEQDAEGRSIRQLHLRIVAEAFPFEQNYGAQKALISWVLDSKPSGAKTEDVVEKIKSRVKLHMPASLVNSIIQDVLSSETPIKVDRNKINLKPQESVRLFHNRSQAEKPSTRETSSNNNEMQRLKWWEGMTNLTNEEKEIAIALFYDMRSPSDVMEERSLSMGELGEAIIEMLQKRGR